MVYQITTTSENDDDCGSCDNPDMPLNECPKSERKCGHHCNHSWTHDHCCWCGIEFGENGMPPPCQPIGCDNGIHLKGCVYAIEPR